MSDDNTVTIATMFCIDYLTQRIDEGADLSDIKGDIVELQGDAVSYTHLTLPTIYSV